MRPDYFTDSTIITTPGQIPPPDYDNGQDTPLASIPLSQLMEGNKPVCPICGAPLPIDVKEVVLDGGIYHCCKSCPKKG